MTEDQDYVLKERIAQGGFGAVYESTRKFNGAKEALKVQPIRSDAAHRELEALARLSWLHSHRVTDLYVRPMGAFQCTSPSSYFPEYQEFVRDKAQRVKEWRRMMPRAADHCLIIRQEWIPFTFQQAGHARRHWNGEEMRYELNTKAKVLADAAVLEVLWGTYQARTHLHMSVLDGASGANYGLKTVPYWRLYQFMGGNGDGDGNGGRVSSLFAVPPDQPMPKRLDLGLWTGCDNHHVLTTTHQQHLSTDTVDDLSKTKTKTMIALDPLADLPLYCRHVNPLLLLKHQFPRTFALNFHSKDALRELDPSGGNMERVFRRHFARYQRPVGWRPLGSEAYRVYTPRRF